MGVGTYAQMVDPGRSPHFVRHQSARRFLSRAAMGPGAGRIGRQHHRRRSRGRPRELLYSRQYPVPRFSNHGRGPARRRRFHSGAHRHRDRRLAETLPSRARRRHQPRRRSPESADALRRPGQHRLAQHRCRRRLDPPVAVCARRDRHLSGGGPGQRQYPLRRHCSLWRFQERRWRPHLDRHLPRHRAGRSHPPRSAAPRPERHGRRTRSQRKVRIREVYWRGGRPVRGGRRRRLRRARKTYRAGSRSVLRRPIPSPGRTPRSRGHRRGASSP